MKVVLRLNGLLSTQVGHARLTLDLPAGSTVSEAKRRMCDAYPAAAALVDRAVVVCRGQLAGPEESLTDGEEIALLMPIAGG